MDSGLIFLRSGMEFTDGERGRLSGGSDGRLLAMEGTACRQIRRPQVLAMARGTRKTVPSRLRHADKKNP